MAKNVKAKIMTTVLTQADRQKVLVPLSSSPLFGAEHCLCKIGLVHTSEYFSLSVYMEIQKLCS